MKLAAQLKALKAAQERVDLLSRQILGSLPAEYGFSTVDAFVRAVRKAKGRDNQTTKRAPRNYPGGVRRIRSKVAKLRAKGESAIGMAVKLGSSLRTVDQCNEGM